MKHKKRFEQYCNRSMPLLTVEYWWRGEYYKLAKWTEGAIKYNPLFVYRKNKGTDVYYDMNNPVEASDDPANFYFKSHSRKFKILADKYEEESGELLKMISENKQENFSKIFKLLVKYWPKLTIVLLLGGFINRKGFEKISRRAYNLRKKIQDAEYKSVNHLIKLAKRKFPYLTNFADFLTFQEITNGKIPREKKLLERQEGYIYFAGKIYTGLSVAQLAKLKKMEIVENAEPAKHNPSSFRGVSAMMGKATGRVRIVFENGQLKKIKKGDILVTPMTTPDFIVAMKKAAAFITDEGGITCHAAITAREMGKPCIIGTKIATQVLKDGDLVEVDANKGVVKIIK